MPEQWRDGIDGADGEIVCLTISVMRPAPGWLDTAWRLSREADGVGGAIEPGDDLRLRDWAEYFCRYARDMLPFPARETHRLPGRQRRLHACGARGRARRLPRRVLGARGEPCASRTRASGSGIPPSSSSTRDARPASGRSFGNASFTAGSTADSAARASPRRGTSRESLLAVLVPVVIAARTYREVFSRATPPPAADRGDAAAARLRRRLGGGRGRRARR